MLPGGTLPARLLAALLALPILFACPPRPALAQQSGQDRPDSAAAFQPDGELSDSTELESGGISLRVHSGYGFGDFAYALPVANAGLGRQGAANSAMAWQLAYNYSVLPVQVDIEHRFATAFKGRVEVECRNSISRVEASGNPVMTISRDVLVPPSVPYQVTLLPRVCPPVTPGGPIWLTVRLYQGDNEKPISVERSYALQFEPYLLYTLHLDGDHEIVADEINAGDHLNFDLSLVIPNFGPERVSDQLLSSANYVIPVPHSQVTAAPLAARDFTFVLADLKKVESWSATDQAGLEAFLLGGGYLCLYNCGSQKSWRGQALLEASKAGRGMLLPLTGDFNSARSAMQAWLEGEMSEFVLLAGGSVKGQRFSDEELSSDRRLSGRLNLAGLLGLYRPRNIQPPAVDNANKPYAQPKWPPHEPGYLNPIWIMREGLRVSAREPWDYPQFSQPNERYLTSSFFNLQAQSLEEPDDTDIPEPMNQLARAPRKFSWMLALALIPPVLLMLISLPAPGRLRSIAAYALGLLCLGVGACFAWQWWNLKTESAPIVRLSLLDLDSSSLQGQRRELIATTRIGSSVQPFDVPEDALVHRLSQDPAGDVHWTTSRPESWRQPESKLSVTGGAEYMALRLDSLESTDSAGQSLIRSHVTRQGEQIEIRLDTSLLPEGSSCMLQTALGWQHVPSGVSSFLVHLQLPRFPAHPGLSRLKQWEGMWRQQNNGWSQQLEMAGIGEQSRLLLALHGELAGGMETLPRLAWLGTMAQPLSGLGAVDLASGRGQAVLWVALPLQASEAQPPTSMEFIRYSFALEPQS